MLSSVSSYFSKIRRQFFRTVENARRPCKRPLEENCDDEESSPRQSYKPLHKKVCLSKDEPLLPITRTLHLEPTLRWEPQKPPPLAPIKENEVTKSDDVKFLNMNKVINIREPVATPAPATRQSSIHSSKVRLQKHKPTASTSTKTVQLKRSPYLEQTHEATDERKRLKTNRSTLSNENSESWPRKCLGGTNYNAGNKKPLSISSTRRKPSILSESFRIEDKRLYQELLQQWTLNKSSSPISPCHSLHQLSSSSDSSSPLTCGVGGSRRSSSQSVQSLAESENTSPTASPNKLLQCYELEDSPFKESGSSEVEKRHPNHYKAHKTKTPLSDITMRKEFRNIRRGTNESVIRRVSLGVDDEEDFSLYQLVKQRCPKKKKHSPVPVIDLCDSDSNSSEKIEESDDDSESIEIVDEFPQGRRKHSILDDLYNRKWKKAVPEECSRIGEETEEELELKKRKDQSQSLHDKVQNRLKQLGLIYSSKDSSKPPTLSIKKSPFVPLTPQMQDEIEAALIPYPKSEVLVNKFSIKITRRDIVTLDGLNWLNDQIVNFYFNLIMERSVKSKKLPRVYVFSTFFYPKLFTSGHKSVSRWTKKVDIFTYDMLLVPIHLGVHWCMATMEFKKRCITYYDSMLGNNSACLEALLGYLEAEHLDKKKKTFKTTAWKLESMKDIPEQMNGSDCGVFSCKFAEYLSRSAPLNFTQEDMPYFRRRMVYEIIKAELLE